MRLQIDGVTAGFGATRVLDGVDLVVPSGTTTAVLGPSGCGKTTLLRVVAGFLRPDGGTVSLGGRPVASPGACTPTQRRGVGYVAQEGALFPHLSVGENVLFGLPWRQRRDTARAGALLELVSLDAGLARRRPDQLSGGQQQRVALARALAREPSVVLLDEPFSALDAALRGSTRRSVAQALAKTGVTVVLVTHDQSEALSFADQVAVMRHGRVVQAGAPQDVYGRPADDEAAAFLGEAVLLPGVLRRDGGRTHVDSVLGLLPVGDEAAPDGRDGDGVTVLVRPERLLLNGSGDLPGAAGTVTGVDYFGHDALVDVRLDAGRQVQARTTGVAVPATGTRVRIGVTGPVRVFAR